VQQQITRARTPPASCQAQREGAVVWWCFNVPLGQGPRRVGDPLGKFKKENVTWYSQTETSVFSDTPHNNSRSDHFPAL